MEKLVSYTNKEISLILGEKPSTISYYTNIGIVVPKIDNSKGRGSVKRYSVGNIVDFILIKELSRNGMELEKIKFILDAVAESEKDYIFFGGAVVLLIGSPNSGKPELTIHKITKNISNIYIDVLKYKRSLVINVTGICKGLVL